MALVVYLQIHGIFTIADGKNSLLQMVGIE